MKNSYFYETIKQVNFRKTIFSDFAISNYYLILRPKTIIQLLCKLKRNKYYYLSKKNCQSEFFCLTATQCLSTKINSSHLVELSMLILLEYYFPQKTYALLICPIFLGNEIEPDIRPVSKQEGPMEFYARTQELKL